MRNLTDAFDLKCPNCGQADKLEITITCFAVVTTGCVDPTGDYEWDDDSYTQCPRCLTNGTVADFTVKTPPKGGAA